MVYQAFDSQAKEYDAWYDTAPGKTIFAMETDCLKPLLHRYYPPYLEIGAGTGRFAEALGIEYAVEPAPSMALIARARGVRVTEATAENLPFANEMFGGILMAFTLCFLDDPRKALAEAWRVLQHGGGLVLGLIFRDSPWGEFYIDKGKNGHPIYSKAKFNTKEETEGLLQVCGFRVIEYYSTLFQPPGQASYRPESPIPGYQKSAGFVSLVSFKRTP